MSPAIRTPHSLIDTTTDKVLAVANLSKREAEDLNRSLATLVAEGFKPREWVRNLAPEK